MRTISRLVAALGALALAAGVAAAASAKPKVLRVGITADLASLDAQEVRDAVTAKVLNNVVDNLVMIPPGSTNLEPGLALSWRPSPKFNEWTFLIRPGVVASDGTPATPQAIVASIGQVTSVAEKAEISVDPTGKAVVFKLKSADADFPSILAQNYAGIVFHSKGTGKPIGTGPFVVAPESTKQKVILVRNPKYWGTAPRLERIEFTSFKGQGNPGQSLLEALQNDKIDLTDGIPIGEMPTILKQGSLAAQAVVGRSVGMLGMNNEVAQFKDVRVRQAIAHAINRDAIVEAFYPKGTGVARAPVPPTIYRAKPDPYDYDPAKAKELLAQAGLAKGFRTTLLQTWTNRPYAASPAGITERIRTDLAAVGIDVTIVKPADANDFFGRLGGGKYELSVLGWIADTGSAADFLESNLSSAMIGSCPACNNMFRYRNTKVDEWIREARATKSRKAIDDVIDAFDKDIPFVPIVYGPEVAAWNRRVTGFKVSPTPTMYLRDLDLAE